MKTIILLSLILLILVGCGSGFQVSKLSENQYEILYNVNNSYYLGYISRTTEMTKKAIGICPNYEILATEKKIHFWDGTLDQIWIIRCK
jgi:hypothetical protein